MSFQITNYAGYGYIRDFYELTLRYQDNVYIIQNYLCMSSILKENYSRLHQTLSDYALEHPDDADFYIISKRFEYCANNGQHLDLLTRLLIDESMLKRLARYHSMEDDWWRSFSEYEDRDIAMSFTKSSAENIKNYDDLVKFYIDLNNFNPQIHIAAEYWPLDKLRTVFFAKSTKSGVEPRWNLWSIELIKQLEINDEFYYNMNYVCRYDRIDLLEVCQWIVLLDPYEWVSACLRYNRIEMIELILKYYPSASDFSYQGHFYREDGTTKETVSLKEVLETGNYFGF